MNATLKKVTLGNSVIDNTGNNLQSHILTLIISYIYSEKRTLSQIANHINMHQIKVMLYLDYLLNENIIMCVEEKIGDLIEKYFYMDIQESNYDISTKVTDHNTLNVVANDMGDKLKKTLLNIETGDINKISYYIASLSEKNAKIMVDEISKLIDKMEELETLSEDEEKQEYILLTALAPHHMN